MSDDYTNSFLTGKPLLERGPARLEKNDVHDN